ncbi:MAG: hypothetical protein H6Q76_2171, partial [Firmicutes bacterium]|nr:hypothetical protein [Bacillota bacterium]
MFLPRTGLYILLCAVMGIVGCAGNSSKPAPPQQVVKVFDPVRFVVAGSGTNLPV